MADKLYSLNGEYPTRLGRIRLPDGTTRTDGTTFTPEEIELAGYTGPYYEPGYDSENQYIEWDSEELKFVVNNYPADRFLEYLRERRDQELSKTDWTQLKDSPLGTREVSGWAAYRQKLRDLPADLTSLPTSSQEVDEILRELSDSITFPKLSSES